MLGNHVPRIELIPPSVNMDAGESVIELAAFAGLHLKLWQQRVIRNACARRLNNTWAAFEVAVVVSRQNGKGSILEARELGGLFLFDEKLQLHSSHEFKTTIEAFRRIRDLVENTDYLRKQVKKITTSHGDEGIELLNGNRLRFVARSTGSGRGFSVDTVYWDEAYNLGSEAKAALMPTLSSRPNPQLWYTSSAGWGISVALNDVRNRAIKPVDGDKRLYFAEWSADPDNYAVDSREDWANANPAMGDLISEEFIEAELFAMRNDPALFARERLSIGQWPTAEGGWSVIPEDVWQDAADPRADAEVGMVLAVDVTPDRSWGSIAAAGKCEGSEKHVIDLIAHRPGTEWIVHKIVKNIQSDRHKIIGVVIAPRGPAGSILPNMERALEKIGKAHLLMKPGANHEAHACVGFVDAFVKEDSVVHLDQDPIATALAHAHQKMTSEQLWTWYRKSLAVDISPLWAVTLALWGFRSRPHKPQPFVLFS